MAKLRDICKDLYMGLKERRGESNRSSPEYQAIDDHDDDKPHRWWIDRHYEAKKAERRAKEEANTHGSKTPAAQSSNTAKSSSEVVPGPKTAAKASAPASSKTAPSKVASSTSKTSNKKSSGEHTKANDRKTPSQTPRKGESSNKPTTSFTTDRYYWSTSDEFLV